MAQFSTGFGDYEKFENDEQGYREWLDAHPHGFVVNSAQNPAPSYLQLHRSSCRFINSHLSSSWTSTGYIKTCAEHVGVLKRWALEQVQGELRPCAFCKPDLDQEIISTPAKLSRASNPIEALGQSSQTTPREVPAAISTGCPELDLAWREYAADILGRCHVLIADTEDDLNWHAFLGHSLDMQGFRAAEFVGIDPLTKTAPGFVPLIERGIGVVELASLWDIPAIHQQLTSRTDGTPITSTLDVLTTAGGEVGKSLAQAFATFPYRKGHWTIRAYLQNCAKLEPYDFSFRRWLKAQCTSLGSASFPPADFRIASSPKHPTLEVALRKQLEQTFYMVGPAIAAYMLCDWQLCLWHQGRTEVFANFKLDSFHEQFVRQFGREVIPTSESEFANWWLSIYPDLPPRLANECIWLAIEHGLFEGGV